MTLLKRDIHHHTYADYLSWSETQRAELVNGTAYIREPPAPSRLHQEVVREMLFQLRSALDGKSWSIQVAPFDVRLPRSNEPDAEIDTVVQPDVLIVRDRTKFDERGMRGAPDWVAEILSPSTASHNQTVKLPVYERAGIREVWFVDPRNRTLMIYRLEGARYGRPTILELKGQTSLTAIPDLRVDWDHLLSQVG
jgi:Uma2 family endonuclease